MVAGIWPKIPYSYYLELLRAVKARAAVDPRQGVHDGRARPDREGREEAARRGAARADRGGPRLGARAAARRSSPSACTSESYRLKISGDAVARHRAHGAPRGPALATARCCTGTSRRSRSASTTSTACGELQDETGGFQTFIPLSFHPDEQRAGAHARADRARRAARDRGRPPDARQHRRTSRPTGSCWAIPIAQLALAYGADDIDGTVVEEKHLPRRRRDDAAARAARRARAVDPRRRPRSRSSATRSTTSCGRPTRPARRAGSRRPWPETLRERAARAAAFSRTGRPTRARPPAA